MSSTGFGPENSDLNGPVRIHRLQPFQIGPHLLQQPFRRVLRPLGNDRVRFEINGLNLVVRPNNQDDQSCPPCIVRSREGRCAVMSTSAKAPSAKSPGCMRQVAHRLVEQLRNLAILCPIRPARLNSRARNRLRGQAALADAPEEGGFAGHAPHCLLLRLAHHRPSTFSPPRFEGDTVRVKRVWRLC